jgi:hypothetical protein
MMKRLLILLSLVAILLAVGIVWATPDSLAVSWWTVDGGGTVPDVSGGSYTLHGTAGQADAGMGSNGRYALNGGFWNKTMTNYTVYLPTVINP